MAARELANFPKWIWDGETLPVPIEDICDSHYGLLIEEDQDLAGLVGAPPGTRLSGLLLANRCEVWVNAGEALVRRRFTVGHELGHWVLHCRGGPSAGHLAIHCRTSEVKHATEQDLSDAYLRYPPSELDANQFGAALLMPARSLRHIAPGADLQDLAREFNVSADAIERRLWFLRQVDKTSPPEGDR